MPKRSTPRRKKPAPRTRKERRGPASIRPSDRDRITSLERRVTALEATYPRIDSKLSHLLDGVRTSNDCNGFLVKSVGELRAERGMQADAPLIKAAAAGDAWNRKSDESKEG